VNQKIYNPKHIFWARVFSSFISPYFIFLNLFRKQYQVSEVEIKKILVTEYHRIGDVLLIAPAIEKLKNTFPKAQIILICDENAKDLASNLFLGDDIISFNAPWTNWEWSPIKWYNAYVFAKSFRKRSIDLAIDFKGDVRNGWFLWNIKAKISLGYNETGGEYFYTNPKSFYSPTHQTTRAIQLLENIGIVDSDYAYSKTNYNLDGAVVIHSGATDPRREWPNEKWIQLIKKLSEDRIICIIKVPETLALIQEAFDAGLRIDTFRGSLIEFKEWLKKQKILIALDSMPAHLASFVGTPVVTLFGSQDPKLTKPLGRMVDVVAPEKPCLHNSEHWRLCKKCIESITVDQVYLAFKNMETRINREQNDD